MRKYLKILIVISLFFLLLEILFLKKKPVVVQPEEKTIEIQNPVEELIVEVPTFLSCPKIRNVDNLGKVLSDIEGHMPSGHGYRDSDFVTWAHETTHGINSRIRNENIARGRINGFYCLEDRMIILNEPETTIERVVRYIPSDLRGPSFNLYLVEQRRYWNGEPLYLFDEWVAYTNGSEVGWEYNYRGWYYELLQAHNFNIYCIAMIKHVKECCKDYDDRELRVFMMWNIERTFRLLENYDYEREVYENPHTVLDYHKTHLHRHDIPEYGDFDMRERVLEYVQRVRESESGDELRDFSRGYFGESWCKKVFGF